MHDHDDDDDHDHDHDAYMPTVPCLTTVRLAVTVYGAEQCRSFSLEFRSRLQGLGMSMLALANAHAYVLQDRIQYDSTKHQFIESASQETQGGRTCGKR